jgi:hypothetical protein
MYHVSSKQRIPFKPGATSARHRRRGHVIGLKASSRCTAVRKSYGPRWPTAHRPNARASRRWIEADHIAGTGYEFDVNRISFIDRSRDQAAPPPAGAAPLPPFRASDPGFASLAPLPPRASDPFCVSSHERRNLTGVVPPNTPRPPARPSAVVEQRLAPAAPMRGAGGPGPPPPLGGGRRATRGWPANSSQRSGPQTGGRT